MTGLLFGTGGVPHSSQNRSTVDGIKRIAELGLGCMEIEFVQGVKMSEASARLVAETATSLNIKLSAHAPYYINLNAHEPEKVRASQDRLLQTARISTICGAESIVFHPAFYLSEPPAKVYDTVKQHLSEVLAQLKRTNTRLWLRPEVTGKLSAFGTLEEILELSAELDGVNPCIDFAHLHARNGAFNSYAEFTSILQQVKKRLGSYALEHIHIHISGIAYGSRGELKHLDIKDSDFQYVEFLRALRDYGAKGMIICESPNLEEDALLLQTAYSTLPN